MYGNGRPGPIPSGVSTGRCAHGSNAPASPVARRLLTVTIRMPAFARSGFITGSTGAPDAHRVRATIVAIFLHERAW